MKVDAPALLMLPSARPDAPRALLRRLVPLALVLLLHASLLFFVRFNEPHTVATTPAAPREVVVSLITPEPAPAPRPTPPQAKPIEPQPAPKPPPPVRKAAPAKRQPRVARSTPAPAAPALPAPAPAAPAPPEPAAPASASPTPPAAPAPPAPPAPAPAAPPLPKTVSGVEYLQPPSPEYPPLSRRSGEEGTVVLRVLVSERGRAERIELQKSSGSPRLDEAARRAVQRAVFKPYVENGRPLPVYVLIPINFQLN